MFPMNLYAMDTPLFSFVCMTDLHLDDMLINSNPNNKEQFKNSVTTAYSMGYRDLFVCGGDISSYGQTSVWDEAKNTIEKAGYTNILWALGNHEYGTTVENLNGDSDFKSFTGYSGIYNHFVISGYHFIALGCESAEVIGKPIGETQVNWFKEELEKAVKDDAAKPVFVITHYQLGNEHMDERIEEYFSQYDNVFLFWGHKHGDEYVDDSSVVST